MKLIHRLSIVLGILLLALLALPTGSAMAATYTVTQTGDDQWNGVCDSNCTLREAVVAANNNPGYDTIVLPAGTYPLELGDTGEDGSLTGDLDIHDDLSILGAGSASTIITDWMGDRVFQVFSGNELYISGVSITDGSEGNGGGIFNSGNLYLEDSAVSGSTAMTGSGGGIYNEGYLNIYNSVISGNTAPGGNGGGIHSDYYGADIYNSTVSGNTAGYYGGGITVGYGGGSLNLSSSIVSGNTATQGWGGGIYSGGTTTVTNSMISSNTANGPGGLGGGMYVDWTTTITDSEFSNNSAASSGGGLVILYGTTTIGGSTFSDNSAAEEGGGIANNTSSTLSLTNTDLTGNFAGLGGGIYNGGTLNVTGSTLTGNYAVAFDASTGFGGAISSGAGTVNVINSSVSGNAASRQGGGVHLKGTNSTITGTTIAGNSLGSGSSIQDPYAGYGAGILYEGGTHAINSSNVSGNTAKSGGGGMMLLGATIGYTELTITDSTISNNDGFSSGGGIQNVGATLNVVRSSIVANSAAFGGAINNSENGYVTITNSTLSGNAGSAYGGGVMHVSGTVTITNSTLYGNSSANGGGIYRWTNTPYNYVYLRNTIVANSPGGNCGGDPPFSNGYNLISDTSCAFPGGGTGDIIGAWPGLDPLANNGGPTPTHALLEGSPAADGGGPGCPTIDQRGIARPQGLRCDIGAYEAPDTDGDGVSDPADSNDDNDGLLDGYDNCPLVAEDYDAFEDTNGCPEPDNDGDGVCDAGQTSPSCTGSDSGKRCFDPADTLSCPTTDCRNLGEDADAFKDGDGCPEPDNDNDGHIDPTDNCPGTDSLAGANGMLGSPQDLNHNGIRDGAEATLTSDDSTLTFEDYDGVLDQDGCHDSPGNDFDQDGLTDDTEVFGRFTDPGNPDTDADTVIDGSDNCPLWPNTAQALPNWPIPTGDSDCDGYPNGVAVGLLAAETYIGTDPTRQCAANSTANNESGADAWPMDFNDNRLANGQDFLTFIYSFAQPVSGPAITVPAMGTFEPERWDFTGNGIINGQDFLKYINFFAKTCTASGS